MTPQPLDTANATNPVQQLLVADLRKKMNDFTARLTADEQRTRRTIPEVIFTRDFLPFFSGEHTAAREQVLSNWYLVSNGPYASVDVVNAAGAVVATVPPLLDRKLTFPNAVQKTSIKHVFDQAKQSGAISPRYAENIIAKEIGLRYMPKQSPEVAHELSAAWRTLLGHYGKGPANKVSATSSDSDLDL